MEFALDISLALQTLRDALPDAVPIFAAMLADALSGAAIFLAGSLVLWCVDKRVGMRMILAYALGYGINQTIKNLACVYRPWILDPRLHIEPAAAKTATGYSFPSGHTVSIASTMSSWAANQKARRAAAVGLAAALIALMAFLRVFLGAHTILDVSAAIGVGLIGAAVAQAVMSWVEANPSRDILTAAAIALICTAVGAFLIMKPYPLDLGLDGLLVSDPRNMLIDVYKTLGLIYGALAGWIMERRLGGFSTEGTLQTKAKRFIPGAALVGIWYVAAKPALLAIGVDLFAVEFIKHFGLLLLMTGLYPALISHIQQKQPN